MGAGFLKKNRIPVRFLRVRFRYCFSADEQGGGGTHALPQPQEGHLQSRLHEEHQPQGKLAVFYENSPF